MWPQTVYKIPLSKVEKLERVINAQVREWQMKWPITSLLEELKPHQSTFFGHDPHWLWRSCRVHSGPSGESGHHLKPWAMQSQHFISGTWLVKFNMGELALGSVQTLLNGTRTRQGRRDEVAEKEKLAKKGQYGLTGWTDSDLVLWSTTAKLTVPWEDGVEEAFERKCLKYSELPTEATQNGWKVRIFPVEVGCRGFHHQSTEVNGGLGVALSNKQSSPCRIQREEAGTGSGLKGRISTGRWDEDGRTRSWGGKLE